MSIISKVDNKKPAFALTLNHIWAAAAIILLILRPLLTAIPPNDFWWHMATGRLIMERGSIPLVDAFSYTRAGEPFFNQSWLAQILLFKLYQLGGIELILIVQALVIGLAYGLLLSLCVRLSGLLRLSVVLLLLATMPLSFDNWTVRPQSYVFPLFVGFLIVLTEYRLGYSKRLWLLPTMMVLWVNMHGSFVLGLALIGITFMGMFLERFQQKQAGVGEWESGRVGKWESGRVGEWESGRVGEWGSRKVGKWETGKVAGSQLEGSGQETADQASGGVGEWERGKVGEGESRRVGELESWRGGEWERGSVAGRQPGGSRQETADQASGGVGEAKAGQQGSRAASRSGLMPLLVWGGISALTTLINPQGLNVLGYVRNLLGSNQVTALVVEWAAPSIRDTGGLIFFLFLVLCFLVFIYARRKPDLTMLLMFLAFLWLALGAVRNIVWFGFVATPLLVMQASTFFRKPAQRSNPGSAVLNAALLALLLFLLVLGLPWVKPGLFPAPSGNLLDPNTPIAAVEILRKQPQRPKHLFHAMAYGSYLIWAAPEQAVFIDPRIELYPFEQWLDYIRLTQGLNVDQIVARYGIDGMLLDKTEQKALLKVLTNSPDWQSYYTDEQTVLLRRVR